MPSKQKSKVRTVKADANPTKAFFAQMLARDISLQAAIFDLLDNSLDGARRLRKDASLDDLWVRITVQSANFVIEDNCGGIPVDIAREYAFRFGRTDKAQLKLDFDHATGQFGVGMKRAIFKLGNGFKIASRSAHGTFTMDENVVDWVARDDEADWSFAMTVQSDEPADEDTRGTRIEIVPLHDTVSDDFGMSDFRAALHKEMAKRYVVPLEEGLSVTLNGKPVVDQAPTILDSKTLAPTVRELRIDSAGRDVENGDEPEIRLRLICGLARIEAPEAGWSMALNSRMVLLDDKTSTVGWGARNGTRIPVFHNQYGRLRGVVLLDSAKTRTLPWNTTKSQLDVDQAVYRRVRREMITAMEPVIKFLNRVKDEVDEARKEGKDPEEQSLHRLIAKATEIPAIARIADATPHEFAPPAKKREITQSDTTTVQYEMDRSRIARAKRELGVKANWQVGEETFEFWWSAQFD